jgi:hypothetical protein
VLRNKIAHAQRGPSRDRLDIVSDAIVAVGGVQVGHREQMVEDMLRQVALAQLPITPLLQRHVNIADGSVQCA